MITRKFNRWVFSSILAIGFLTSQIGCSTTQTPQTIAYKTIASITTTVDTARQAWNSYATTGAATQSQIASVAKAYTTYQLSVMVAQAAENSFATNNDTNALNQTVMAVSQSSSALLGLINSFSTTNK